jgi:PqqD family protein of HPr-rel-A system
LIDPVARREDADLRVPSDSPRWRVPEGQHFVFADFDDGVVMFDARIGATHLLNATAAETLSIVEQTPGLPTETIYRALLERLELEESALTYDAVIELLWQLENLGLVAAIDR